MTDTTKTYLGDSVYAIFDGYAITITTENGLPNDPSNEIYMEPEVLEALAVFVKSFVKSLEKKCTG